MQIFSHFSPDTLPSDALRENIHVERSFTQEVKRMQSSHFLAFVYSISFFLLRQYLSSYRVVSFALFARLHTHVYTLRHTLKASVCDIARDLFIFGLVLICEACLDS